MQGVKEFVCDNIVNDAFKIGTSEQAEQLGMKYLLKN